MNKHVIPFLMATSSFALIVLFQNCQPAFHASTEILQGPSALGEATSLALATTEAPSQTHKFEIQRLDVEGVNAVAYWQDPIDPQLLWGRRLTYTGAQVRPEGEDPAREETWNHWNLVQYRIDFAAKTIRQLRTVTNLSASQRTITLGDGTTVFSAYDPSVFAIGPQRYIAFECATTTPNHVPGVCIGPVSADGQLDLARTALTIEGASVSTGSQAQSSYVPSGSVPKVLVQGSQVILSWTVVKVTPSEPARFAEEIDTRSVLLKMNSSGLWRALGHAGPLRAEDPSSSLIFTPEMAGGTADIYGLARLKGRLISVSSVGNCVLPLSPVDGCYSLDVRISEGSRINARGSVNFMRPILTDLPRNPVQYFRLVRTPEGRPALLGFWLPPRAETPASRQVPAGAAIVFHPTLDAINQLSSIAPPLEIEPAPPISEPPKATPTPSPRPSLSWRSLPMGWERVIQRNYQTLLGRSASQAESSAWAAEVARRSLSCQDLQKGVALSSEYAQRRASLSLSQQITDLYISTLEREPEPAGLEWHLSLFSSQGFGGIVNSIIDSPEARMKCF